MEYNYPGQAGAISPNQQQAIPGQQQQPAAPRGRGRRAYAAQQYDFNAPAAAPMYEQQPQYPPNQAYHQGQASIATSQPPYGQPQTYPQQGGYQYGQEYQAPGPNVYQQQQGYQQGYQQGPPNVAGMTSQFQNMQVAQVDLLRLILILARSCQPLDFG